MSFKPAGLVLCIIALLLVPLLLCAYEQTAKIASINIQTELKIDDTKLISGSGLAVGNPYQTEDVLAAVGYFQTELTRLGYYYVSIPFPEIIPGSDGGLELRFRFEEELASVVSQLSFSGLRYFSEAKLRELAYIKDQDLPLNMLPDLLNRILELYLERGYLFAEVGVDSLVAGEQMKAYIRIREGKVVKPTKFRIEGNKTTRDNTLIALSGLAQQRIITPLVLEQAEINILRKSYIKSCEVIPLDESSILIRVEEGKMTYLEGVLGLSEREGGKREINGLMRLRFMNLWGTDRSIRLFYRQLPSGTGEIELIYHESGSAHLPIAGDLIFYRATQDSTWIKMRTQADIYYYLASSKYGIELATESVQPGTPQSVVESNSSRSIGAFWNYQRTDNAYNPGKGLESGLRYRQIYVKGNKQKKTMTAVELDKITYLKLTSRFTLSIGMHLRHLDDPKAQDYEQFNMGGYNSLRGYFEDEFHSRQLGWLNNELRYRMGPSSRTYLFFDTGAYENSAENLKKDLYSIGFGIKVGTKLGILGLEYGLGYRDKSFVDIGLGMVHAGLETTF